MNPLFSTSNPECEIIITRKLDFPRELVFTAWSSPEHIAQWFGPIGFTLTTHEMNMTAGGVWRFTLHGPDGVDYPNKIEYREVLKPEQIIYTHSDDIEHANPGFHVVVTFAQTGNTTKLTLRSIFPSDEERDYMAKQCNAIEKGNQTLSRLDDYLVQLNAAKETTC